METNKRSKLQKCADTLSYILRSNSSSVMFQALVEKIIPSPGRKEEKQRQTTNETAGIFQKVPSCTLEKNANRYIPKTFLLPFP